LRRPTHLGHKNKFSSHNLEQLKSFDKKTSDFVRENTLSKLYKKFLLKKTRDGFFVSQRNLCKLALNLPNFTNIPQTAANQ
jgi:hypothetical protein